MTGMFYRGFGARGDRLRGALVQDAERDEKGQPLWLKLAAGGYMLTHCSGQSVRATLPPPRKTDLHGSPTPIAAAHIADLTPIWGPFAFTGQRRWQRVWCARETGQLEGCGGSHSLQPAY